MPTRQPYPFKLPLSYVDSSRLVVMYDIQCFSDNDVHVKVIGDPGNGAYEWVVENKEGVTFSDRGYGIAECALKDGLAFWWDEQIWIDTLKENAKHKTHTQLKAYRRED